MTVTPLTPGTSLRVPDAATWRPALTGEELHAYAVQAGICGRPLVRRVTDRQTGDTTVVPIRCGSTRDTVCPACATRARNLRAQQCAEGWHLDEDPLREANSEVGEADEEGDDRENHQDGAEDVDPTTAHDDEGRRVRSTRRRDDAADLPRVPMDSRTVGRAFTGRDGVTYRPSMFVTLTLPSYGKVLDGAPVDPAGYDYARAARDAIALSALVDRWVQNLRRCAGYKVQYFAVIEAQRRLAGHVHLAIRGAIPRALLRQVTRATYAQQWWPAYGPEHVTYPGGGDDQANRDQLPVWVPTADGGGGYVDPVTREPLLTWAQALDQLDAARAAGHGFPSHVTRFGVQVDVKGLIAPSADAERAVRYLTKYLTKSISDTYAPMDPTTGRPAVTGAMAAHVDRLHEEVRWTPCGPRCANWLRYGVQPADAGPGAVPGMCPGRAHDRENLGLGGRRVLASRQWSGKTLREHAADRAAVVRETLAAAGIEAPEAQRLAADAVDEEGRPRYVWEALDPADIDHGTYAVAILALALERQQWRRQFEQAKRHRDGPEPACGRPLSNSPWVALDEEGQAA